MSNNPVIPTTLAALWAAGLAAAVDVGGNHINANEEFGNDASYKLTGDTTFAYGTGNIAGDIDLNGFKFVSDTGGGNRRTFSGAISGTGSFEWLGGGVPQVCPATLAGEKSNTFKGTLTVARGVLDLAKPAGVDAVPGDLVLGTVDSASIRLVKANQINDASNVTLGPKGICSLELQGNAEKFATLSVTTHAVIDMGASPATLAVGASSACHWDLTKTVTVRNFRPGKDQLVFGRDGGGVTKERLARIGFENPAGMGKGLYTAKIGSDGQLAPDAPVTVINPPFDVSAKAIADRAGIYEVNGLADLTGKGSPLKDGMTIAFFGDSITWQNGYVPAIDAAIKAGEGSKDKAVKLINRKVAKETGTPLVDLRKAYIAYLQNNNAKIRVDGTLYFKTAGVLTHDGVHPTASGVALLANLIGDGLFRALGKQ